MVAAATHRVLGIEWHEPVLAATHDAALEAEAKKLTGGLVPVVLTYIARVEWVARAFIATLSSRYAYVDPATVQLIGLVASYENACRHCYGHRRAVLRIQGISDAQIERLEHDLELAELSEEKRAILDFARTLARSRPRPARAHAQALVERGVSQGAVAEIVAEVANWCLGNRIATTLAVPPEQKLEAFVDSFFGRLLRPWIAWKMRRDLRRVAPMPAVDLAGVPYGAVLEPIASTHMGRVLGGAIEEAFASTVLPRRTKALVFAIVAKSLGCAGCTSESCRILDAEGLDAASIDAALEHLAAPGGDPIEEKIIALARDSVHYRPAEIQDRARALVDELGPERLLEAVAVAALANAIVRIGMLRA